MAQSNRVAYVFCSDRDAELASDSCILAGRFHNECFEAYYPSMSNLEKLDVVEERIFSELEGRQSP